MQTTGKEGDDPAPSDRLVPAPAAEPSRPSIMAAGSRGYGYAAGESVVHNASQPWRVVGAMALDYVRGRRQSLELPAADVEAGGSGVLYHENDADMRRRSETGPHPDMALKPSVLGDMRVAAADLLQDGQGNPALPSEQQPPDPKLAATPEEGREGHGPEGRVDDYAKDDDASSAADSNAPRGHYDPKQDIILRLEYITARETKAAFVFLYSAVLAGVVALFAEFGYILRLDPRGGPFRNSTSRIVDVSVATVCLVLLTGTLGTFVERVWRGRQLGKVWSARRRKASTLLFIELVVQWVNVVCWLVPNIYLLVRRCAWFGTVVPWTALVRWTCWNTIFLLFFIHAHNGNPWHSGPVRRTQTGVVESIVQDAPLRFHWPKLLLWGAMEVAVVLCVCWYAYGPDEKRPSRVHIPPGQEADCSAWSFDCSNTSRQLGLVILMVALAIAYLVLFAAFMYRTWRALAAKPVVEFKMGFVIVRLQLRMRGIVAAFFVLSMVLLWLARSNTCAAFTFTWLGLLPMQVVMTATVVTWCFFCMPKDPDTAPLLQVWLSEFAWTEAEKCAKLKSRRVSEAACAALSSEPMFCMETAMKAFYWSGLVYDYEEAGKTGLSLETGMSLWGLQHSELFWEKQLDTKCLMAWNADTCVISFRGTASITNALADIQAWRTAHPPKRGHFWLGSQPLVHAGFLKSWRAGGLHSKVVARVLAVLTEGEAAEGGRGLKHVFVTGHSLGGALATLASYDLAVALKAAGVTFRLACNTFGAPRTGNHAFAADYERRVPDTWSVINDQDAVARGAKFLMMYKRPGQRVIINEIGDMLVRPTFLEASMHQVPGGSSVAHHLLSNYQKSFLAVLLAQFGNKRFRGGAPGVVALARASQPVQELLLDRAGLSVEELERLSRWGALTPKVFDLKRNSRQDGKRSSKKGGLGSAGSSMSTMSSSRGSGRSGRAGELDAAAAAAVANNV
ncbi:hypothetical protein WJX72_005360 [[Myrmecia] bisecta]|uniref:Fungal lipase-type domain-containing protein n=1 Tax=[Myrmecia] bisecta TaxID=41462 RepID=A0AAW1P865_9CHLO